MSRTPGLARALLAALVLAGGLAGEVAAATAAGAAAPPAARALRTVEGRVTAVSEAPGEGALPLVTLRVATASGPLDLLAAPASALADAGFQVAVGDLVRARVFLDPGGGVAYAQKLLNRSQALMLHLRTLRQEPLWDAAGRWQGGPIAAPGRRPPAETAVRPERRRPLPPRRPPGPPARPRGDSG